MTGLLTDVLPWVLAAVCAVGWWRESGLRRDDARDRLHRRRVDEGEARRREQLRRAMGGDAS